MGCGAGAASASRTAAGAQGPAGVWPSSWPAEGGHRPVSQTRTRGPDRVTGCPRPRHLAFWSGWTPGFRTLGTGWQRASFHSAFLFRPQEGWWTSQHVTSHIGQQQGRRPSPTGRCARHVAVWVRSVGPRCRSHAADEVTAAQLGHKPSLGRARPAGADPALIPLQPATA